MRSIFLASPIAHGILVAVAVGLDFDGLGWCHEGD